MVQVIDSYMDLLAEEKSKLVRSMAKEVHSVMKSKIDASKPTFSALRDSLNNQ